MTSCGPQYEDDASIGGDNDGGSYTLRQGFNANGIQDQIVFRPDTRFTQTELKAISSAAEHWNYVIGRDVFLIGTPSYLANVRSKFYDILDEPESYIIKKYDWNSTGKSSSVLGSTIWDLNDLSGKITKASIFINAQDYDLIDAVSMDPSSRTPGKQMLDFESLLIHEMGHALGFMHVPAERQSIMSPKLYVGTSFFNRKFTKRDFSRVRQLYPANELEQDLDQSYESYLFQPFVKRDAFTSRDADK